MSVAYLNYNASGTEITDEALVINTAAAQSLVHDHIISIEVWTGEGKTGSQLAASTDYTLGDYDSFYKTYNSITFVTHNGETVYCTYLTKGDKNSADDVNSKADKVASPTAGNFAALDANGNLADSGSKPTDFNLYTHPNHSGDVTSVGDGATTIANNVVTNSKLADMAANTLKGNATASEADPSDITIAANTFPARASTGTLAAKSITDFGLGLVAAADAAAGRSALGALGSANIVQTITNGVTDKAPSEDAVYDALAMKRNINTTIGSGFYHYRDLAYYSVPNYSVGVLKIGLPFGYTGTANMFELRITGFKYRSVVAEDSDQGSLDVRVHCYVANGYVYSPRAVVVCGTKLISTSDMVRLGYDSLNDRFYILIGSASTIFSFTRIVIADVYSTVARTYFEGITFSVSADISDLSIISLFTVIYAPTASPIFTGSITTPIIKPEADSTTALQITKANGTTSVMTLDTTNSRIGIGVTPSEPLHVAGNIKGTGYLELSEITEPDAGAADTARLYIVANGSLTDLRFRANGENGQRVALCGRENSYSKTQGFAIVDNGNSGASKTIDWRAGNKQKMTLTDDCEISVTDPSNSAPLELRLKQDTTGGRTVTWSGMTIKWEDGIAATLTAASNAIDIIEFSYDSGEDTYYGYYRNGFASPA